jgi:BMFP domain-containing protein YqiC
MTPEEELALRKEQLAASKNQYGYRDRVEALKARIAELEAQLNV